jgi:hypothetical protein
MATLKSEKEKDKKYCGSLWAGFVPWFFFQHVTSVGH